MCSNYKSYISENNTLFLGQNKLNKIWWKLESKWKLFQIKITALVEIIFDTKQQQYKRRERAEESWWNQEKENFWGWRHIEAEKTSNNVKVLYIMVHRIPKRKEEEERSLVISFFKYDFINKKKQIVNKLRSID